MCTRSLRRRPCRATPTSASSVVAEIQEMTQTSCCFVTNAMPRTTPRASALTARCSAIGRSPIEEFYSKTIVQRHFRVRLHEPRLVLVHRLDRPEPKVEPLQLQADVRRSVAVAVQTPLAARAEAQPAHLGHRGGRLGVPAPRFVRLLGVVAGPSERGSELLVELGVALRPAPLRHGRVVAAIVAAAVEARLRPAAPDELSTSTE
eukprot:1048762-Prymnesium_polylepis.1